MTLRFRVCFTVATVIAAIVLADDADACGGRFRLFSGGLFGRRCELAPCPIEKVAVEPIKEPVLPAVSKDLRENVRNIAKLFKDKNVTGAKKLAQLTARDPKLIEEIPDLMHMYRPVDKGGLSIGSVSGK